MVTAQDVRHILRHLSKHGIQVWLTGGWGIDALLGTNARPHKDLDMLLQLKDISRARRLLEAHGYRLMELWSENRPAKDPDGVDTDTAFVLQDAQGRQVDLHALELDQLGNAIPAWEEDRELVWRRQDLAGEGCIEGVRVCCISAEMQVRCHSGYELPPHQVADLRRLQEKFNLPPTGVLTAGKP